MRYFCFNRNKNYATACYIAVMLHFIGQISWIVCSKICRNLNTFSLRFNGSLSWPLREIGLADLERLTVKPEYLFLALKFEVVLNQFQFWGYESITTER